MRFLLWAVDFFWECVLDTLNSPKKYKVEVFQQFFINFFVESKKSEFCMCFVIFKCVIYCTLQNMGKFNILFSSTHQIHYIRL